MKNENESTATKKKKRKEEKCFVISLDKCEDEELGCNVTIVIMSEIS